MSKDQDDTSSIPYVPYHFDYMRDVFRPKLFIKGTSQSPTSDANKAHEQQSSSTPMYSSIYQGVLELEKANTSVLEELSAEEKREAEKLYRKNLEIEKKFFAKRNSNMSETKTETETNYYNQNKESSCRPKEIQFVVNQCSCPECSPRYCEDGTMKCALCDVVLKNDNWMTHIQSICHQINQKGKTHNYINPFMNPSSNAFKWMSSMGWKEGEGLGYQGQGKLEPIATRLKNDRLGVGAYTSLPLQITHTPHDNDGQPRESPEVAKERERLIKKYGKKQLKKMIKKHKEAKQKKREQEIMREFSVY